MIELVALLWVAVLLVGQPVAAYRGRARLQGPRPPRRRLYLTTAVGIGTMGLVAGALDAATGGQALRALGLLLPGPALAAWCLGTAAAMALFWLASQAGRAALGRSPGSGVMAMLPRTGRERAAFGALSVWAGLCEELAFRGFCLFQLQHLTGSLAVAALVTTVGFGMGHLYQGWLGVARTAVAGALLMVPVLATGSLIPSVVGHAVMDLMTGLWMAPLLRRWGVPADEIEAG